MPELDYAEARAMNLRGGLLREQGHHTRALLAYRAALQAFVGLGDYSAQAGVLNNIGLTYASGGDHDIAMEHYEHALELIRKKCGDRGLLADVTSNVGFSAYQLGKREEAIEYWKSSLTDSVRLKRSVQKIAQVFSNIATASHYDEWDNLRRFLRELFSEIPIIEAKDMRFEQVCKDADVINGRQFYECEIFVAVEEEVLAEILMVLYRLHPTFLTSNLQPLVFSPSKNDFRIKIQCWGEFRIGVFVVFRNWSCGEFFHALRLR